jgi:hypothetical protein
MKTSRSIKGPSGYGVSQMLCVPALATLFAACQRPPAAPTNVTVAPPAATSVTVEPPEVPPPSTSPSPAACPIVPVALILTPTGAEPRTVLALDDKGHLDVSLFSHRSGAATLDSQGCLAGRDGLWAEWTPRDQVWTPHETLAVAGNCIQLANGRALCLAADGKVDVRAKDEAEVKAMGTMQIRGYRGEARCASLVLLATFMSMMPSMAVVDGQPAHAPAPEGSRCTAYHRPSR